MNKISFFAKGTKYRPIIIGILATVFVFVIGFGVLLIMYYHWSNSITESYAGLKGLFDYKASLWGDAFCLPLTVGSGLTYILVFYRKVKKKKKLLFPVIAGVIGGVIGLAMQLQWVISDSTPLNWSIPEQHHFNYAGWYHAAFFVIICSTIAFISACLLQIDIHLLHNVNLNSKYEKNIFSFCQFIIWFCGILFLQLHYLDDYSDKFPQWGIILLFSVSGLIALCGFRLIVLKGIHNYYKYYAPVIFAVIISTLLSFISVSGLPSCDISFLISSILFSSLYVCNSKNKVKMFWLALFFGALVWLCEISVSNQLQVGNFALAVVMIVCCAIVMFAVSLSDYLLFEKHHDYDNNKHPLIISVASIISITLIVLANIRSLSVFIRELGLLDSYKYQGGTFLIGAIIPKYVTYSFNKIKRIEDNRCGSEMIDKFKMSQYIIYFLIYTSALILLINCLEFKINNVLNENDTIIIGAVVAIIILCGVMIKVVKKTSLSIAFLILFYLSITAYLIVTGISKTFQILSIIQNDFNTASFWIVITLIIMTSCTISVFMTLSVMYNVSLIRQFAMTRHISISAIIIGVFSGLCYGIAAYQLLIIQTVFYVFQLLAVTMLAFAVIPYLQASVLNAGGDVGILDNYARSSVMQDGFLYSAVATVNPIVTISLINSIMNGYWLQPLLLCGAYAVILTPMWRYCINNNVEHCRKKEELLLELCNKPLPKRDKENLHIQYNNLRVYLTLQNIIAIILSMPYTIVFLIKTVFENSEEDEANPTIIPE